MLRFNKFFFLSNLGGIAISIVFLVLFCVMVMTRKYIDDMFHSLRTHVCLTWILAMVMHIVTGNFGNNFEDSFGTILGTISRLTMGTIFRQILGTVSKLIYGAISRLILGQFWNNFETSLEQF